MGKTAEQVNVLDQAWAVAADSAGKAAVEVAILGSLNELRDAAELYDEVWSDASGDPLMPLGILRAMAHSGNYVVGAYDNGSMIGALCGFFGGGNGRWHLHSHILGVLPVAQGRNVGYALKQHQRAWSLERGIRRVNWTFDPLVARNAYFNLTKLGADAAAYYPNFYGQMNDAINAGEESDRLLVEWVLDSRKAIAASNGDSSEVPDVDKARSNGAVVALDENESGEPVSRSSGGAKSLLCRVPSDIVALRAQNPERASAWRKAQRATLGDAIHDGYRVDAVTRSGWFFLSRR
jgi:predicted GNAT superfamily acetyltransferase